MIYVLLPAYNEESNVVPQLRRIKECFGSREYRVVIVDDGSTDGTRKEVEKMKNEMPLELIVHPINQGVGRAFSAGFRWLFQEIRGDDTIITMDFDNTQQMNTVNFMMSKIDEGYEIVNGSVFTMGGMLIGAPFVRYMLARCCNWMYGIVFFIKGIHDYTGFFRAHKGSALKTAYDKFGDRLIESRGFAVMAEMLIKFRQIPLFITEVPMIVRYDLKGGQSKLRVYPTIKEHLKVIAKNAFKRRIV